MCFGNVVAGIMRLESAVHFCDEVLSGKLYSNQLVIKDGKLMQKANAKISTVDDSLAKDPKPATLASEMPKLVLSASHMPQTKLVRPPTLVSVGTQVYPALLNVVGCGPAKGGKKSTAVVGLGLENTDKYCGDGTKLHQLVSENRSVSDFNKTHLLSEVGKPGRQSQRVRQKPVKLTLAGETCSEMKGCRSSDVTCHTTTCSGIRLADDDDAENGMVTGSVTASSDSVEKAEEKLMDYKLTSEDLESGGKFQCSLCTFSTNNVRKISQHNRQHQKANNICYYCEQRFGSSAELSTHVDDDHADIKTSRLPFVCSCCPSRFRTRAQLMAHLPKHSSTRPFICATCGASFKWRNTLYDHAATHTSHKEHLCDICGYATAHRGQLRSHRRVHTGSTLCCSWQGCDYRATRMQNLKYHLLTHTQEKPHQCEVCGQSFSLAKNLKRHMMSHMKTATKHK